MRHLQVLYRLHASLLPETLSYISISFSLSSNPHKNGVSAPTSKACVVTAKRWFNIRVISLNNTRIYCARVGTTKPHNSFNSFTVTVLLRHHRKHNLDDQNKVTLACNFCILLIFRSLYVTNLYAGQHALQLHRLILTLNVKHHVLPDVAGRKFIVKFFTPINSSFNSLFPHGLTNIKFLYS